MLQKLKKNVCNFRISHNTISAPPAARPDILSSMMQSNVTGLGTITVAAAPPPTTTQMPSNNGWHSANPLVMNHQLASPQASNNNSFSLDDLDPFAGGRPSVGAPKANNTNGANMYTVQQPTVNYIYPTGYSLNSIQQHQQQQLLGKPSQAPTLQPQTQPLLPTDNQNLNALSQQDILNFLN